MKTALAIVSAILGLVVLMAVIVAIGSIAILLIWKLVGWLIDLLDL